MATWNSPQPLRITQTKVVTNEGQEFRNFDGFHLIEMGEKVPDEMLTEDFIGNCVDQLANLTAADRKKLEAWKARHPRIQGKWDHLDRSPMHSRIIFPPQSSIATVGASKRGG